MVLVASTIGSSPHSRSESLSCILLRQQERSSASLQAVHLFYAGRNAGRARPEVWVCGPVGRREGVVSRPEVGEHRVVHGDLATTFGFPASPPAVPEEAGVATGAVRYKCMSDLVQAIKRHGE